MIQFQKLEIQNFLSFGEKQTIHLADQGIVRVEGRNLDEEGQDSNRAGKSAIIEAIVWCLFGKTIRGLRHDKVVNRFSKRNCSVLLEFQVGSHSYSVRRYRKDKKRQNRLCLWSGDKQISFRHEEDCQKRIIDVLGIDFTGFGSSVIFGGVRPFAALSDAEQKRVLESILRFDRFDAAQVRTKKLIHEGEEVLQKVESKLLGLAERAKSLRHSRRALESSSRSFKEELKDELKKARHELQELGSADTDSVVPLEKAESVLGRTRSKLSALEERKRLLKKQFKELERTIDNRASLLGKPCPTCGVKVRQSTLALYLKHLVSERRGVRSELQAMEDSIDKREREVKHAAAELKAVQKQQSKLEHFRRERADKERRVESLSQRIHSARLSPLEMELAQTAKKYSKTMTSILRLQSKRLRVQAVLKDLEFWEQGFGNKGIKSVVIREALPAMNAKLAEYANEIFGGKAELKFRASKETKSGEERELFHIHYVAKRGGDSYTAESTGGRRRIDICVLLVFAWLSRTSNLLFVDELLDGLDDSGRESVLGILSGLRGTVLVISHQEIRSKAGKLWLVEKKGGLSRVITEAS